MPEGQCSGIGPAIKFSWQLERGGETVQSGTSAKMVGGAYTNDTVALEFSSFQGKRGQHYTLDMDILQDGSRLAITNPKLRVRVAAFTNEDFAVTGFLALAIGAVCCLVGGAMVAIALIVARNRRREVNEPAPSAG